MVLLIYGVRLPPLCQKPHINLLGRVTDQVFSESEEWDIDTVSETIASEYERATNLSINKEKQNLPIEEKRTIDVKEIREWLNFIITIISVVLGVTNSSATTINNYNYTQQVNNYYIVGMGYDAKELNTTIDESQIAAITKGNLARGDKAAIDILGEDWGRQQAANILGDLARNPGAGGVGAMGAGMGMGMAAGSVFGNMANQMFAPMGQQQAQPVQQPMQQPAQPVSSGRFAPKGQPVQQATSQAPQAATEDPFETLSKLKRMLDAGLISQQQYDTKVAEVMSRM